jgi:hypothetical protein
VRWEKMVPYLVWKNRIFRRALNELLKEKEYESIIYLVGNDSQWNLPYIEYFDFENEPYFFDLILIKFCDEEGNKRKMVMPVPLLPQATIRKIIRLIKVGALKVAHRQWHDRYKSFPEITDFYPPTSSEEEECYTSSEEEED